ncbi:cytochrome d ubiquinol oxidase subunit II [Kocuria coralli]|uniref:Cytochrome d ubiquinol oxidase subunit II n=1 Tax=Kocuria coralli TaxID=1461025 RepID=A0A5J5L083_9MICC|nr:cytochrome d ubiquinol oxidase subunit II [Kocuria coralli]KAA9394446.1 cytochrome d ubiquinol oxidase subunit II [Kocuria coralli]
MDVLPVIWFAVIAFLWTGYLVLDGFDLGVGMRIWARGGSEKQKRLMLNAIGPVWDGNEVWLITVGAGTFAAFPLWYASLFSTLYIPLTLVLLALIFRAVAIEYRGKRHTQRWRAGWDRALGFGSFFIAFGIGAMLASTTLGLPIDANGDRVGGPFAWLSWHALLGGLAVAGFSWVHGAAFLTVKTSGHVHEQARRAVVRWMPWAVAPLIGWVLVVQVRHGSTVSWLLVVLAVIALVGAWAAAYVDRDGWAFTGLAAFLVAGSAAIFTAVFPVLVPSTVDGAFDLTVYNASSGSYALTVMTWIAGVALPLILVYQSWSYWVFRKRLTEQHIPDAHDFLPAILRR